jgi:hypothetical protein
VTTPRIGRPTTPLPAPDAEKGRKKRAKSILFSQSPMTPAEAAIYARRTGRTTASPWPP